MPKKSRIILSEILRRKRNKPRAHRALKDKQYDKLFETDCPRMIRYVPSEELGEAVVRYVTRGLSRLSAEKLCGILYERLQRLPLRIGVDAPADRYWLSKVRWCSMGIRDKYVRYALMRYLRDMHYTWSWSEKLRSRRGFRVVFVRTHVGSM